MSDERHHHHGEDGGECRQLVDRLSEYIDGELPVDLCARIEEHCKDCRPCEAFIESLRRTVRLIESDEAPRLPDEARAELLAAWRRVDDSHL